MTRRHASKWGTRLILVLSSAALTLSVGCGGKKGDENKANDNNVNAEPPVAPKPEPPGPPRTPLEADPGGASGEALWATSFGSKHDEQPNAIAVDAKGNIVIAGRFFKTIDFGFGALTSKGGKTAGDIFVVHLDPTGKPTWAISLGGKEDDIVEDVKIDSKGNVVITGRYAAGMMAGEAPLLSKGADDVFVIKLDATGKVAWARSFGNDNNESGFGLAIDENDDILVTGWFRGIVNFGSGPLQAKGNDDIFLMRLGEDGSFKWVKVWGGMGLDYGRSIAIDSRGDIVLAAEFTSEVDFGSGTKIKNKNNREIVIAKYTSDGTYRWAKPFGNNHDNIVLGLGLDPADNIIFSGTQRKTVNYGGDNLKTAGQTDAYIVKLDANGKHVWSKRFGGKGLDSAPDLGVDKYGNVIVTGWFEDEVSFGGKTLKALGNNRDGYILKINAAGVLVWSMRFGNTDHDRGKALEVSADGSLTVVGAFRFEVSFGEHKIDSVHEAGAKIAPPDIFVARFKP